jgi:NTP pyrophosphatase (non-canonical NTP hydrolase)
MNITEHLLSCLAEECAEVSQACSKALRFGLDDKGPNHALTNAEYIAHELSDVLAVLELLVEDAGVAIPNPYNDAAIAAKKAKVRKYMQYAIKRGTLQSDNLECTEECFSSMRCKVTGSPVPCDRRLHTQDTQHQIQQLKND